MMTATKQVRRGCHCLAEALAPLGVKPVILALFLSLAAPTVTGCIPEYTNPEEGVTLSKDPTPSGITSDPIKQAPLPTSSSRSLGTPPSEHPDSCVAIGWPIEQLSRVVGFALTTVKSLPNGCSYSTDQAPFTRVEISRRQITDHAAFEAEFTQLTTTAAAKGTCVWASPEHLVFTCTGAFGKTEAFEGASTSMVFINDHAVELIVGTEDPAFVPSAETGSRKLAAETRTRNL